MCSDKPDYIRMWDEQMARAFQQKRTAGEDNGSFWDNPVNVDRYVKRLQNDDRGRVEKQLASMKIPQGSSVLDIGAGPGTLSVPLALSGSSVTVVEPSGPMIRGMETYRALTNAPPIRVIQKTWEEASLLEIGRHDVVIASLSLMMENIRDCIKKMDACANSAVHLFWFLIPPSLSRGNKDLWPLLHGEPYDYEPTADILWNVLFQLGIYANLTVESRSVGQAYTSVEEMHQDYYTRLLANTDEQKGVVDRYLGERIRKTENGYVLPGTSKTAHIWWEK
ncbi:MAG: class I SAM-dependent methyltransferase [Methanocorpusculum sp.]|uniref:class I SAM-dependent methyltransferase n=1 Tax=Methanocorpusculum sp. TaxID=2058474 RepID=UPI00271E8E76|nr:class I SAM-dependent methyltransferase [Methanocorpusculum sp.]MDO9523344.1 class I SAM-dependent methyltransferase [Methanocorpusculum sp.]